MQTAIYIDLYSHLSVVINKQTISINANNNCVDAQMDLTGSDRSGCCQDAVEQYVYPLLIA